MIKIICGMLILVIYDSLAFDALPAVAWALIGAGFVEMIRGYKL